MPAGDPARRMALRLYVAGISERSTRAIQLARRLCDETEGLCELTVVDVYQQPGLAEVDHVLAVPTLVKTLPSPSRRLVGNLSSLEDIRAGLGLESR